MSRRERVIQVAESNPRSNMSIGKRVFIITLLALAFGGLGGYLGTILTAPFYFGFGFGFVLVGMIGMFVLAAHIESQNNKNLP